MKTFPLHLMSRKETLQAMEALWADLSAVPGEMKSPAWHDDELAQTESDVAAGKQEFVDWTIARREINRR